MQGPHGARACLIDAQRRLQFSTCIVASGGARCFPVSSICPFDLLQDPPRWPRAGHLRVEFAVLKQKKIKNAAELGVWSLRFDSIVPKDSFRSQPHCKKNYNCLIVNIFLVKLIIPFHPDCKTIFEMFKNKFPS